MDARDLQKFHELECDGFTDTAALIQVRGRVRVRGRLHRHCRPDTG